MRTLLFLVWILAAAAGLAHSAAPGPSGPADTPKLAMQAERNYLARDWNDAIGLYEQLTGLNPTNGMYRYRLGECLLNAERHAEAIKPLTIAMELGAFQAHPVKWVHRGEAAHLLAAAYAHLGQRDEAIAMTRLSLQQGLRQIRKFHGERFSPVLGDPEFRELTWAGLDQVDSLSRDECFRRDLAFAVHELKRLHYVPFRAHSEAEIDALVTALDAEIPSLNEDQFYVRMMAIISAFGDGHTRWLRETPLLPLALFVFPEGLHVLGASKEHAELVGARILAIGGQPADEVLECAQKIVPIENPMTAHWEAAGVLRSATVLRGLGLAPAEGTIQLQVEDAQGRERKIELAPRTEPMSRADYVFAVPGCKTPLPHCMRNRHEIFWHEMLPDGKTMYCQLNGIGHGSQFFHRYFEKLFAEIDTSGAERLVLDLRWNGGGNTFLNAPLIEGIVRSNAFRKPGNLFVVVGRNTFSAAINTTVELERRTNAILVGEPPASPPNFVGESVEVVLPATRWPISISDLWWQTSYPMDYRTMLSPQIYVPPSAAAFRAHRDPALETIEAYLEAQAPKS